MADHPLLETAIEAAIDAEVETGRRETTRAQAVRAVIIRLARITAGFAVLLAGVAMLVLPGPGLVVIAAGLVILARDFVWADRLLTKVRARLPEKLGGKKGDQPADAEVPPAGAVAGAAPIEPVVGGAVADDIAAGAVAAAAVPVAVPAGDQPLRSR